MRNSFHNIVSSTFDTPMGKWSGIGDDASIRSLIVVIQPLASWHSCNKLVMPDKSIQTSITSAEYHQINNIDFDIVINFLIWNFEHKACSPSHLPSIQIQTFRSVPVKLGMSKAEPACFPSSSIFSLLCSPLIQYIIYEQSWNHPSQRSRPCHPSQPISRWRNTAVDRYSQDLTPQTRTSNLKGQPESRPYSQMKTLPPSFDIQAGSRSHMPRAKVSRNFPRRPRSQRQDQLITRNTFPVVARITLHENVSSRTR